MRVFLFSLVFFAAATAASTATVTITGHCTLHALIDGQYTPVYSTDSPDCDGYASTGHRVDGAATPYLIHNFSEVSFGSGTFDNRPVVAAGYVEVRRDLEVVVLGGTGSGYAFIFTRGDIYWPEGLFGFGNVDTFWAFGGCGGSVFEHKLCPFTFGEPLWFSLEHRLWVPPADPNWEGSPRVASFVRVDVELIRGGQYDPAVYIVPASAIPEPAVGMLCGFGLALIAWRLKKKPGASIARNSVAHRQ
jgi:hypothetical protein